MDEWESVCGCDDPKLQSLWTCKGCSNASCICICGEVLMSGGDRWGVDLISCSWRWCKTGCGQSYLKHIMTPNNFVFSELLKL